MTTAFARSRKNAPTSGTITKATREGPKRSVTACMLAMAVGRPAQAEAALPGPQHHRVVGAPHRRVGDLHHPDRHERGLGGQDERAPAGPGRRVPRAARLMSAMARKSARLTFPTTDTARSKGS